ncbi:MAG: type II toxin-antitoxin system prevent-host-death family antitoxin [Thermomicrobiales bacterium]
MEEMISAAEANRAFSRILREVREGQTFVVTSHGKPVARIVPASEHDAARKAAREALFAHLATRPIIKVEPWTRDDLYDDE